jgi:hypothetical protein
VINSILSLFSTSWDQILSAAQARATPQPLHLWPRPSQVSVRLRARPYRHQLC